MVWGTDTLPSKDVDGPSDVLVLNGEANGYFVIYTTDISLEGARQYCVGRENVLDDKYRFCNKFCNVTSDNTLNIFGCPSGLLRFL